MESIIEIETQEPHPVFEPVVNSSIDIEPLDIPPEIEPVEKLSSLIPDIYDPEVHTDFVPSLDKPETIPKVIKNSDFLFKSDIKWEGNVEYVEPNQYEIEMLAGTKNPVELLKEESEVEEIVLKSEEEIKKQKTKDLLLIFKVVALNRMGNHPIHNTSHFTPLKIQEFLKIMNSLIEDYNNDLEVAITDEFNKICNEKLFNNSTDVSQYPIYS